MGEVSRAFDLRREEQLLRSQTTAVPLPIEQARAWRHVGAGEKRPAMFQLRRRSGERLCFAYHDLREVCVRDAGCVRLGVFGMHSLLITVEGRNLGDLADLLSYAAIQWIGEADEPDLAPESSPSVSQIKIEPYPRGGWINGS